MRLMLSSMYQQLTNLVIEPEKVKLPPMSWVYVYHTCNLFMSYRVGKDMLQMVES